MAKNYGSRGGNDRADGRIIRSLGGFARFLPFISKKRSEAFSYYEDSYEVTDCGRWIKTQRSRGYRNMGLLHLLIAAYVRVIAALPGLNRFVAGRRIYARNDIEVSLLVRRGSAADSPTTAIKVGFEPSDTVFDVYRKVDDAIAKTMEEEDGNATDDFVTFLANAPRFVTRIILWVLRALDYFGVFPKKVEALSPLHSSFMVSDMGSLGASPMYPHVHNFGTLPVYINYGATQRIEDTDENGKALERRFFEARFAVDSRIVDTKYYASAFKLFRSFMENPEALEIPPEKVIDDAY